MTDHGILRQYGHKVEATEGHLVSEGPPQRDQLPDPQRRGEIRFFIHPRCKNTIKGLRSVTFVEGAEDFIVDKAPGLEHWTDSLG